MSLNTNDLTQIREIFIEGLEAVVLPRFDQMDIRFDRLEGDVDILKTDVAELKTDVAVLKTDMRQVKTELREVNQSLSRLEGRVEALENDVKELYAIVSQQSTTGKDYSKLSIEQKFLKMHAEFIQLAKQANITLPS